MADGNARAQTFANCGVHDRIYRKSELRALGRHVERLGVLAPRGLEELLHAAVGIAIAATRVHLPPLSIATADLLHACNGQAEQARPAWPCQGHLWG